MSLLARALGTVVTALLLIVVADAPAGFGGGPGEINALDPTPESAPEATPEATPVSGWETVFRDDFDGPAGSVPAQWHTMFGQDAAFHDGQGRLSVDRFSQIRTHAGWTLPAGAKVRVTASILMPDTGISYAAFWVQHPNGIDPREIDVIESYGPLKPAGAQLGSHICYDDTAETAANACAATGRAPELFPVTSFFSTGVEPWHTWWAYAAEFTIGGDVTRYTASDVQGSNAYEITSTPDVRRVPGNAAPFHLRLSNKPVQPEHAVPGGSRTTMLVDWVTVEVDHP